MSTEISLGYQMFSIAKILHEAIFLNGTLLNMETWPNFGKQKICEFERIEQGLFRKILSAHSKTPIESKYLEMGVVPFRFHLMAKRIMYYHTIMSRADDEITKRILLHQKETNIKGDFYYQVNTDMDKIAITEEDILTKSEVTIKDQVKENVKQAAFKYLIDIAKTHSKTRHNIYQNLNGMEYFRDPRFSTEYTKLLFKFRTRMFSVRNNFRNNYASTLCPLCAAEEDSQEHLLTCSVIKSYYTTTMKYDEIFSDDINVLLDTASELTKIVNIRSTLVADD